MGIDDPVLLAFGSAGGIGALVLFGKFMLKQIGIAAVDAKGDVAKMDVISHMQQELERLRNRIETLESKVGRLTDRLVTVRGHALVAYGIVNSMCAGCGCPQVDQLKDTLTAIIKED